MSEESTVDGVAHSKALEETIGLLDTLLHAVSRPEALSMPCFESTISPLTSSTEQSTTAAFPATAASIVKCYPQPTKSYHSSAPLTSYQISAPQTNNMDYVNLDSLEIRPKSFLHDEMDEFNAIFSELTTSGIVAGKHAARNNQNGANSTRNLERNSPGNALLTRGDSFDARLSKTMDELRPTNSPRPIYELASSPPARDQYLQSGGSDLGHISRRGVNIAGAGNLSMDDYFDSVVEPERSDLVDFSSGSNTRRPEYQGSEPRFHCFCQDMHNFCQTCGLPIQESTRDVLDSTRQFQDSTSHVQDLTRTLQNPTRHMQDSIRQPNSTRNVPDYSQPCGFDNTSHSCATGVNEGLRGRSGVVRRHSEVEGGERVAEGGVRLRRRRHGSARPLGRVDREFQDLEVDPISYNDACPWLDLQGSEVAGLRLDIAGLRSELIGSRSELIESRPEVLGTRSKFMGSMSRTEPEDFNGRVDGRILNVEDVKLSGLNNDEEVDSGYQTAESTLASLTHPSASSSRSLRLARGDPGLYTPLPTSIPSRSPPRPHSDPLILAQDFRGDEIRRKGSRNKTEAENFGRWVNISGENRSEGNTSNISNKCEMACYLPNIELERSTETVTCSNTFSKTGTGDSTGRLLHRSICTEADTIRETDRGTCTQQGNSTGKAIPSDTIKQTINGTHTDIQQGHLSLTTPGSFPKPQCNHSNHNCNRCGGSMRNNRYHGSAKHPSNFGSMQSGSQHLTRSISQEMMRLKRAGCIELGLKRHNQKVNLRGDGDRLVSLIEKYNDLCRGPVINLESNGSEYKGFVRIHLNVYRPISMSITSRPTSIVDLLVPNESKPVDSQLASFYLPEGSAKVIHITSEMTTEEVIRTLLHKYNIMDNPSKFALYERRPAARPTTTESASDNSESAAALNGSSNCEANSAAKAIANILAAAYATETAVAAVTTPGPESTATTTTSTDSSVAANINAAAAKNTENTSATAANTNATASADNSIGTDGSKVAAMTSTVTEKPATNNLTAVIAVSANNSENTAVNSATSHTAAATDIGHAAAVADNREEMALVSRRLAADECPLEVCLRWAELRDVELFNMCRLSLQDAVKGQIMWDEFSVPELQNFLLILDREESTYEEMIRQRYAYNKRDLVKRLSKLEITSGRVSSA